ncbi:MAG: DUF6029 family protein [Polyangia bacterium]
MRDSTPSNESAMAAIAAVLAAVLLPPSVVAAEEQTPDKEEEEAFAEPPPSNSCGHTRRPAPTPVSIRGTETFISQYVGDNGSVNENAYGDDDEYWTFRNLLYFQAGNRHFDSSIRLDLTLFHEPPLRVSPEHFAPGGEGYTTLRYDNDIRVERISTTAHLGDVHVTAGDFYVSFGRGIALSLIKMDDVGVDNALRGARVEYHVPRRFRLVAVGGVVNSLNVDPLTHQLQRDDPLDRIAGARAEWEIMDAASLGVHGVFISPRFDSESQVAPERIYVDQAPGIGAFSGGASAELHAGGAHLYLEGDAQSHDNYRPPEGQEDVHAESGYAAFGEFSYDLAPFMIRAEGIFYRRWLMEGGYRGSSTSIGQAQPLPYHHMPTLEPIWMVIKSFGNAFGGRLGGDLYLADSDTQLKATVASLKYLGGVLPQGEWDDHPPTAVVHPTLELRQGFAESGITLGADGGFRWETTDEPEVAGHDNGHLWHVQTDVSVPITGPHSIEVKLQLRRHELSVTEGIDYWITLTSLAYDLSGLFGITLVHEHSDQTAGAVPRLGGWALPFPRQHYFWTMLSLHPPHPLDDLTARLVAGSQRGGIKCAGGVCRNYPDSVGARLEAVYRF